METTTLNNVFKLKNLPQISVPYSIIINKLNSNNIDSSQGNINPNLLIPTQKFVDNNYSESYSDEFLNDNPIIISNDYKIIDGHRRYNHCLVNDIPANIFKVKLNFDDSVRQLNKIQDNYDYELQRNELEEVVGQDILNDMNDINYDSDTITTDNYKKDYVINDNLDKDGDENDNKILLNSKKEDKNDEFKTKDKPKFTQTITAYRDKELNNDSQIGNFFSLIYQEGYNKYDIEFDNLLDTNNFDIDFSNLSNGDIIKQIAKIWFPHINFKKLIEEKNIDINKLMIRFITIKAIKMGFDGIKYGDKILQGFK